MAHTIRFSAFFVALLCLTVSDVRADLLWLQQAQTCTDFSDGLQKNFGDITSPENLNESQKREVAVVLQEACNFQFSKCFPRFCAERFRNSKNMSAAMGDDAPAAPDALVDQPTDDDSSSSGTELDWLSKPMKCDELIQEIKTRFSDRAKLAALTSEQRKEMREILCGERFVQCGFCKNKK